MVAIESSKQVTDLVMGILSERQRHRQRTDLKNLYRGAKRVEPKIDEDQFMEVFKKLAASGAGSLIIGRRGNPNRFIWKYNLKDIAEAVKTSGVSVATFKALGEKPKEIVPPKAKPVKRAAKAPVAVKMKSETKVPVTTRKPRGEPVAAKPGTFLQIDLSTMSPADVAALISLVSPVVKKP
jgi:hypothetical protein